MQQCSGVDAAQDGDGFALEPGDFVQGPGQPLDNAGELLDLLGERGVLVPLALDLLLGGVPCRGQRGGLLQ